MEDAQIIPTKIYRFPNWDRTSASEGIENYPNAAESDNVYYVNYFNGLACRVAHMNPEKMSKRTNGRHHLSMPVTHERDNRYRSRDSEEHPFRVDCKPKQLECRTESAPCTTYI